ncbi:MAG TPA: hypothetical protein VMY37_10745 [Thermoguttaceae bacterium]|nr:hypothetical protein [Thermoguttaceae bacterium]
MPSLRRLTTAFAVFLVFVSWGVAMEPWLAAEAAERAKAPAGPMVPVLEEFDGAHANGTWEIHQYQGTFEYQVKPDAMVMVDQRNANQHLTRRGFQLDPQRPYAVEARFTIHERTAQRPPDSFCLNFHVAGPEDSFDSISCWSMNVDVAPKQGAGGVMKHMGFVDGRFRQIGQRKVAWATTGVEYRLRVEVNLDQSGRFKPNLLTVTVMEGDQTRERFEVDCSSFPYQPDPSGPVRVGVNTHGADWTMRDFKVYAEASSAVEKQEKSS